MAGWWQHPRFQIYKTKNFFFVGQHACPNTETARKQNKMNYNKKMERNIITDISDLERDRERERERERGREEEKEEKEVVNIKMYNFASNDIFFQSSQNWQCIFSPKMVIKMIITFTITNHHPTLHSTTAIGASLSETHTRELVENFLYVHCIYMCVCIIRNSVCSIKISIPC